MKPASFEYHRAHDVRGATELLAELGPDAKLLAGGQSLVSMMNFRLARPDSLVDLRRVDGLRYLRADGDALRIGALTTHRAIETSTELPGSFQVLPRAARWIGHYPIRTQGTIGGSLAHADSTAEWCLLAVLLGAEIAVRSTRGQRTIEAEDFFHGFLTTALEPDEMIVEVRFPRPAPHAALTQFARRSGDFAIVAAAVSLDVADGRCRGGRVALGGVDAVPIRVPAAEAALADVDLGAEAFTACAEAAAAAIEPAEDAHGSPDAAAIEPAEDAHGSPEYRRKLTRALVLRACQEAMAG